MSIDQKQLSARLKAARADSGLTQEAVAAAIGVPRSAVAQFEGANRAVSTLELAKLADLYRRSIASFFEETSPSTEEDIMVALFRAAESVKDHPEWHSEIARYVAICRVGVELERRLDRPPQASLPAYPMPHPQKVMEAVEQGTAVAEQERRRLTLGHNPIPDVSDLIRSQNIWASGANLPEEMSGLFLRHSSIGFCILVQYDHPRARKRFSYAHEYAHVLLDRENLATVSLEQNRADFSEVRANAFAAAFLLPRTGVWSFLSARSKAGPSVVEQTVYDPASEVNDSQIRGHRRASPASQRLTFEDVAALAHHFGVSYQATLFRLKSLTIVNAAEFDKLREKESFGKSYLEVLELFDDLEGKDQRKPDREMVSQVLHLALEAFRREEISQGELCDLSSLLGIPAQQLLALAEAA